MSNQNHPEKGSNITVEPIRSLEDIRAIKKLLSDKPRDYLLFTMGINNGLRIGDLLKLKVRDVQGVRPGETVRVRVVVTTENSKSAFYPRSGVFFYPTYLKRVAEFISKIFNKLYIKPLKFTKTLINRELILSGCYIY